MALGRLLQSLARPAAAAARGPRQQQAAQHVDPEARLKGGTSGPSPASPSPSPGGSPRSTKTAASGSSDSDIGGGSRPSSPSGGGGTGDGGLIASRPAPPTVTELRVTDLYPDANPGIGGWEEAALYFGFYFICAPVASALGNAALLYALGWYGAHRALWGLYFAYWALLYLDLVPKVCMGVCIRGKCVVSGCGVGIDSLTDPLPQPSPKTHSRST